MYTPDNLAGIIILITSIALCACVFTIVEWIKDENGSDDEKNS